MFDSGSQTKSEMPSFGSRYSMQGKLAAGGMGAVFKAYDNHLARDVAIKVLHPGITSDVVIRFQKEAKATAKLDHPNILKVLDFGQTADGDLYLVMDFIDGFSLDDYIREKERLSLEEAMPLFIQICRGLEHAHEKKILHRDMKPSNVMLSQNENGKLHVYVVDFGLAKLETDDQKLTSTGLRIGSPLYMSPEQCACKPVDQSSDVYSLGCLMFKTLTGSPPFLGDSYLETIESHINEFAPKLSDKCDVEFSRQVEEMLAKCLAKDPDLRYQSVAELHENLREIAQTVLSHEIEGELIEAIPVALPIRSETESSGKSLLFRYWYLTLPVALLVLVVPFIIGLVLHRDPGREATKASDKQLISQSSKPKERSRVAPDPGSEIETAIKEAMGGDYGFDSGDTKSVKSQNIESSKSALNLGWYKNYLNDTIESSEELKGLLTPEEKKQILSEEMERRYDPGVTRLLYGQETKKMLVYLYNLFGDKEMIGVWKDPLVEEYLSNPRDWQVLKKQEKFVNNPSMKKLLSNSYFMAIENDAKYISLFQGSAFKKYRKEPLNWKKLRVYESLRSEGREQLRESSNLLNKFEGYNGF